MKPTIQKFVGIPIAVVLRTTPAKWELTPNPHRLPKIGDSVDRPRCFVARDIDVPLIEWRKGITLPAPPPPPVYHDALALRERFMALKTDRSFLDFLNQVGRFTSLTKAEHRFGWTVEELLLCQEIFGELARRSPDTWNEYVESLGSRVPSGILSSLNLATRQQIQFHWRGTPPTYWFGARNLAVIETTDVISAVLTTIELDHLRGARFGVCARPDCPKFFEITSKHKRKYCTQYCAHFASIRRMRERQKRQKSKSLPPPRKPKRPRQG